MSSIKVVDVNNNEEDKQEEAIEQPIEGAKEEAKEEINEVVNEVVEETPANKQETKTEVIEEVCKEVKPVKAQDATQEPRKLCDKLVRCPKCNREMKLKSFRYGHQQKCNGGIENTPVKPFSKPRATPKPKIQPVIKQVEIEDASPEARELRDPQQSQPKQVVQSTNPAVIKQIPQPSNPLADITNHYQLLQNQFIQQKKEKYNNLCQNMFAPKSKKR